MWDTIRELKLAEPDMGKTPKGLPGITCITESGNIY
jgi:hypothetical protein